MQVEYVGYMFPYLSINRNVCIFGSICIQIILFLGDVEQKQSWKRGGRGRRHGTLGCLGSRFCSRSPARSRLFEDAPRRSAGAQHPRRGGTPRPRPIRRLREGCSGQGCRVARRQQRPRVFSPPLYLLRVAPRDPTALLPVPLNSPAAWGRRRVPFRGLPATAPLPAVPGAIGSSQVRRRNAVNE